MHSQNLGLRSKLKIPGPEFNLLTFWLTWRFILVQSYRGRPDKQHKTRYLLAETCIRFLCFERSLFNSNNLVLLSLISVTINFCKAATENIIQTHLIRVAGHIWFFCTILATINLFTWLWSCPSFFSAINIFQKAATRSLVPVPIHKAVWFNQTIVAHFYFIIASLLPVMTAIMPLLLPSITSIIASL